VIDENSGLPVPEGVIGTLVITPLWNNTMTPFLRWNSGDLVSLKSTGEADGPWSIFPVMRHARRTVGFFKVRGVNINHSELEDLMFLDVDVADFKAEADTSSSGLELLRLLIETRRGIDSEAVARRVRQEISRAFDVMPEIVVLEPGTLGREFEASVKAPRFVDKRG
jgi:phenylacetate-CoA ligase